MFVVFRKVSRFNTSKSRRDEPSFQSWGPYCRAAGPRGVMAGTLAGVKSPQQARVTSALGCILTLPLLQLFQLGLPPSISAACTFFAASPRGVTDLILFSRGALAPLGAASLSPPRLSSLLAPLTSAKRRDEEKTRY